MRVRRADEDQAGGRAGGGAGGSKTFNLTVEIVKPRPGYKYPLDKPEARDQRNPRCYGLPNPKVPSPDYLALDGTQDDLWWKNPDDPNGGGRGRALSNVFVDPGSMSEKEKIKSVLGRRRGPPPTSCPTSPR
ncbi:hypothetical protein [Actinomadura madurae]|uniref:hypothetical protein n=1 Tax=Actinomadura madurae TaxID=1993 RepID=UPI0020D2335D|nr:hypothetical protein [Actinomadura madurae]MCQ0006278.1 hypothetical protein [Actinomadura madurae]